MKEIKERVAAESKDAELRNWFEDYTRPGRRIVAQEAKKIDPTLPERVLWHCDDLYGSIIAVGEVGVLAGQGGSGKSRLALQWALESRGAKVGKTGVKVMEGNVIYMSYEDSPARVRQRLVHLVGGKDADLPDGLKVINMMGVPLFLQQSENSMPCRSKQWREVWDTVHQADPTLVIIDPIAEAFRCSGHFVNEARSFHSALQIEALAGEFGILTIAHSTKAARAKGADVYDPGQVSGSAGIVDSARGVLSLRWDDEGNAQLGWKENEGVHQVSLRCIKANHGSSRWVETLRSDKGGPFTKVESLSAQASGKASEKFGSGKKKDEEMSVDEEIKGIFR